MVELIPQLIYFYRYTRSEGRYTHRYYVFVIPAPHTVGSSCHRLFKMVFFNSPHSFKLRLVACDVACSHRMPCACHRLSAGLTQQWRPKARHFKKTHSRVGRFIQTHNTNNGLTAKLFFQGVILIGLLLPCCMYDPEIQATTPIIICPYDVSGRCWCS